MTENIVWLDFNDAIDPREAQLNDTEALRAGLLDRLESVLLYLFPQGRIRGGKFYVGDVDGNAGKSLVVELEAIAGGSGRTLPATKAATSSICGRDPRDCRPDMTFPGWPVRSGNGWAWRRRLKQSHVEKAVRCRLMSWGRIPRSGTT